MSEKNENQSKTQENDKELTAAQLAKQAEKTNDTKLTAEEKAALKVVTGETTGKKYKLKDENSQYSENDFTLAGKQKKELPDDPSDALIARIRSGFIVEA